MTDLLTVRAAIETADHEALVREWYLDSAKPPVGTWAIGVTNRSGHSVDRYKDNPQPLATCLAVYVWLLRTNYVPAVLRAFDGFALSEAQFAAALSWHWNTGAIGHTDWVTLAKDGKRTAAREFLEDHYLNGGDLASRRKAEAALFFDGVWANKDGKINVYPVLKPSYHPDFRHPQRIDVRADMQKALAS